MSRPSTQKMIGFDREKTMNFVEVLKMYNDWTMQITKKNL